MKQTVVGRVTITAPRPFNDFLNQIAIFEGGVTAKYDVTTITADRLELHYAEGEQSGFAKGQVVLLDPDATIHAEQLEFTWKPVEKLKPDDRRLYAKNVVMVIAGAYVRAESMEIKAGVWEFINVSITSCGRKNPAYLLTSRKLTVIPGKKGRVSRPTIYIAGHKILTGRDQFFNLDPRVQGLRAPGVSYRQGAGMGIDWSSGFIVNENTTLSADFNMFPKSYPGYGAQISRTFIDADKSNGIVAPRSELSERFNFGYFDSIETTSPGNERGYVSSPRHSVSVGSYWHIGTSARLFDVPVTKAAELAYEYGGKLGRFSALTQVRLQSINERSGPFTTRLGFQTSVLAPKVDITKNLFTHARLDLNGTQSTHSFGWVRGTAGVVYEPMKQLRLGAAMVHSYQGSDPDFDFDELVQTDGAVIRADLNLGPTKISAMSKFDKRLGWFDREYTVSQVIGCVEAFWMSRRFPREYRLGVRLRLDNFFDVFQRRKLERKSSQRTLISSPENP